MSAAGALPLAGPAPLQWGSWLLSPSERMILRETASIGAPCPVPTLDLQPLTRGQADAVAILELQPALPELALAFLHSGLLLAQLVDDDVELPLQDVDLPLGQLLLTPPQQLLLVLLLERCPRQFLLPGAEFLHSGRDQQRGSWW